MLVQLIFLLEFEIRRWERRNKLAVYRVENRMRYKTELVNLGLSTLNRLNICSALTVLNIDTAKLRVENLAQTTFSLSPIRYNAPWRKDWWCTKLCFSNNNKGTIWSVGSWVLWCNPLQTNEGLGYLRLSLFLCLQYWQGLLLFYTFTSI